MSRRHSQNSSHCAVAPLSNKNVFSDCQFTATLRCGGKLFHSPGLAAAKALSPKVLWVSVTKVIFGSSRTEPKRKVSGWVVCVCVYVCESAVGSVQVLRNGW